MITSALVAYFLSDFLTSSSKIDVPQIMTTYEQQGEGKLLVSVHSTGVFGSVARGATRVELATLNLSASCDADIRIESIGVKHVGLGGVSDIDSVYLAAGYRRISRARSFDGQSQIADLRTPHFIIPKCGAVRVSVLVNISRDANVASEHGVTIEDANLFQTTAKSVTVTQGSETQTVTATPDKVGNVTVNFLPINTRFRYGRIETVARLQFTADTTNDFLLKKITLTNRGGARDMNLINLKLETRSGEIVTALVQHMRGEQATFTFDPTYVLERGNTVVFLVTATINASQSKKIDFALEEPADLETKLYRPRK